MQGQMEGNSAASLRVFIDQAPVPIAMFDRDMRYIAASRRWISDYGFAHRQWRGVSHYELFPDLPERWRAIHQRALRGEVVAQAEDRFDRADGTVQWLRWEIRPWYQDDQQGGVIIFAEDISERTQLQGALVAAEALRKELREQAIRDPLTGLFNRRFLEESMGFELARARRTGSSLG